ncbi:MAG: 5-(carboxyamino)imidazole ribonucleotide synthase [Azospirillaceae bacterium]
MSLQPLSPGATIGMLGGGQLGRMTALAAARLGLRTHVFCPEPGSPTAQVAAAVTLSGYGDKAALDAFARAVDVVTYEFENIPLETVRHLATRVPVRPGADLLAVCQDRLAEKRFAQRLGLGTAPFAPVDSAADLDRAIATIGLPAILKTRRLGYDGKGQARLDTADDVAPALAAMNGAPAILEGFVGFEAELSVIVARNAMGEVALWPAAENRHRDHILKTSTAPAPRPAAVLREAETIGRTLAEAFDLTGLLAVELFLTPDGRLLVNEMAPRPHNSGHWTQDGAATCQFEQFARAVCGLPLGPADALFRTEMTNLIGDEVDQVPRLLAEPGAKLHLYGKAEARPGRKMGHVNRRLAPLAPPAGD